MTKESFVLIIPGCFKTFPRCQSIRTGTEIFCPTGYVWRNNCQVDGQIIMLIFLVNREAILHGPYKRRDGTADPKPGICSSCASSRTGARASTCHQLAAWLQLFPKLMPPVSRWRLLRGNKKKQIPSLSWFHRALLILVGFLLILMKGVYALGLEKRHMSPFHPPTPIHSPHCIHTVLVLSP